MQGRAEAVQNRAEVRRDIRAVGVEGNVAGDVELELVVLGLADLDAGVLELADGGIEVIEGECDVKSDVTISMSADNANKFWRGEYNATVGMAKGEAKTRGPVGKILKLLPAAKPVFPLYKQLVAEKDAAQS